MGNRKTKRVVITGIGVVSPIGIGRQIFWDNLLAGKTGIGKITLFDASTYPSQLAAEVRDFNPETHLTARQIKYFSRATQFALVATKEAKEDANLKNLDPYRTDIVLGTGTPAFDVIEEQFFNKTSLAREYEAKAVEPTALLKAFSNAPACAIALSLQTQGYITTLSTACASGLNAIGSAFERIQEGKADVAITGSVDTPLNHFIFGSFCAARFITTGQTASKSVAPFDKKRTKRALGEGAAIFVLESYENAVARNAKIYAEIKSFSQMPENVNELYAIDTSGERWAKNITKVLRKKKGEKKRKVQYINAHAPSDRYSDRSETSALKISISNNIHSIPVSSIKAAIGQGFSCAGSMQVASAALSMATNNIPPTIHYTEPDPDCDLKVVKTTTKLRAKNILINTRGLGSINSSLILKRFKL